MDAMRGPYEEDRRPDTELEIPWTRGESVKYKGERRTSLRKSRRVVYTG